MKTEETIRGYALASVDGLLSSLSLTLGLAALRKDPDSIHDVRVRARRFAQSLTAFEEFLPSATVKKIGRRLKKLMRVSSQIRNRDIALEFLGEAAPPALRERLDRERAMYQEEFAALAEAWRVREFSTRWRAALARGNGKRDRSGDAASHARSALPVLATAFFRDGRKAALALRSHRKLHRFRLETKRVRYTLELYRPFYGPAFGGLLEKLKQIQNHLGKMSDSATLEGLFHDEPTLAAGARQRADRHTARFRTYWRNEFDAPGEEERWVQYLRRKRAVRR